MRLLSVAMLFALTLVLARALGPEQLGVYAFLFSLMQVSVIAGNGGLLHQIVRDVAISLGNEDKELARGYLWMGWVIAVPAAVVMALTFGLILVPSLAANSEIPDGTALLGGLYVGAMVIVGMLEAAIRGSGRALLGQVAELILRPSVQLFLIVLAILGLLTPDFDVRFALNAAMYAAIFALTVTLLNYFRTTIVLGPMPPTPVNRGFFRGLMMLSATVWMGAINANLSLIVLGAVGDDIGAGLFQISAQLTTMMTLGLVATNASMAPRMSRLMASSEIDDIKKLQALASATCLLSLAFGLPLAVTYLLFGDVLIPIIFGVPFADAYTSTIILAFGHLINITFGSVAILLYANKQESTVLGAVIAATLCNLLLSLLLIPSYSATGAAIASATSLIVWNTISFLGLARETGILSLPLGSLLGKKRGRES